ncbi:MSHA biogenesis protein MshK [Undibacterium seohonense]|jgi:MSHA biogenesis protein MshK|uniref:MSHA biogenesis protein MshK n=1 Tax=Undibacterium seohonense TaxID=1344950 RepID=UPI001FE5A587|nr:MSHA biogenesis protein MshK [Undibacterium seohonense]
MAQSLKTYWRPVLCWSLLFVLPVSVFAQNLPDPTRPPVSLLQSDAGVVVPTGPILQSILISPQRKIAIIDGQTVKLNGKVGNQTLVNISETEVVLKSGKQLQTLSLHPDLIKKKNRASAKMN